MDVQPAPVAVGSNALLPLHAIGISKLGDPGRLRQIRSHALRIRLRAAVLRNMPLANMTQMTDGEREVLRAWIDQGAKIQ